MCLLLYFSNYVLAVVILDGRDEYRSKVALSGDGRKCAGTDHPYTTTIAQILTTLPL